MLVLFDHGTPAPLASFLKGHTVRKTKDLNWDILSNGELLKAAEEAGFQGAMHQPDYDSVVSARAFDALAILSNALIYFVVLAALDRLIVRWTSSRS